MSILSKAIHRLNAIPVKAPMAFLTDLERKMILKFVWNHKKTYLNKALLRKKSKAGGIMLPDLKYTTKQQ